MILPSKHLASDRCLLSVASEVLDNLEPDGDTPSDLWIRTKRKKASVGRDNQIPYDWFVLSLNMLFALGLINSANGVITRIERE